MQAPRPAQCSPSYQLEDLVTKRYVSTTTTTIAAPPARVWAALVSPEASREYFFGSTVASDFTRGSAITFTGEWDGKPFEDHGTILEVDEPHLLRYTHFSPLTGEPDVPESYHTLTFTIEEAPGGTVVTLDQDNNASQEAADHSSENWRTVLEGLRTVVEKSARGGRHSAG